MVKHCALTHVTSCLEIVTKKACLFEVQILDRKHVLLKKPTCFRFLQRFHDHIGESGKTVNAKQLVFEHNAFYTTGGKANDIYHAYNLEPIFSKRCTKQGEGRKRGRRRTRSQRVMLHMVRACRGARSSLGTLSVSTSSPCAVMSTDSLLPAMMIPGGILLVATLCIIMPLHQVALTVFLPMRPCPSSPAWHRRILRRLLQCLRHLPSSSTSVHSGREKLLLGHCAQVGVPLQSRPLPRFISNVARYKGNCQYCKQHCGFATPHP
jgi:hypothetical protein